MTPSKRRLLTTGLTLNALAVALEWRMGGSTSDGSRGSTRGNRVVALKWPEGTGPRIETLNTLLSLHWGVNIVYSNNDEQYHKNNIVFNKNTNNMLNNKKNNNIHKNNNYNITKQ